MWFYVTFRSTKGGGDFMLHLGALREGWFYVTFRSTKGGCGFMLHLGALRE